ncbi:antifungal protein ginkbilobin-like protein [Rhodamnia argentea]|uniref:Antifungal protein ginkbilobin-like protein n=1 Tax=Rhodamnia argentea TaxID=178133 RepID=A0A8B8Q9W0_9MYRT|nr:antifungal protein ginkbilobin-like protein [Rhodamnia argentea]
MPIIGAPDTGVASRSCNAVSYLSNGPYANSVAYVLADMVNVTPNHANYDCSTTSPYPTEAAYGHATSNLELSYSDCGICSSSAKLQILADCLYSLGVYMALQDSCMRYDFYSFTG